MNVEADKLTVADVGRMELIFIQLAQDELHNMLNMDFFKNNRETHIQRLLLKDAFNDHYKALKRCVVSTLGKEEYDNIISMMAETADELDNNVSVIRNCFMSQLCMKMKYGEYEAMSVILCLETLLKLADGICSIVIPEGNKRTKNVIKALEELCNKQKVHFLNGNMLDFDNTETYIGVESLIKKVQKLSKKYSYGN